MAKSLITKHMIETIVSPTLNKGEKEKLKSELNAIFTDASKIDFNTPETRASLNSLTNAFKAIFSAAGITNIDFNELINMPAANSFAKLGELASTQFWDAWNAVATQSNKNGIVNNVQQQLAQLERERASSMKQLNSVKQMMDRYDNAAGVAYLELDEFSQLPKQKDIDKQANMVMDQYDDSLTKLSELTKGAKGYNLALLQAFESYENLFRMKATIDANMDNVSDETLKMYDVRTLKALTKPFVAKYGSEMDTVSEKAVDHYSAKISTLKEGLAGIDAQISAIKQNNSEIISQSDADTTSQRLKQIEEAYNRILNKSGTINKKAKEKIESALDYTAGEQSLTTLKKGYEKSLISGENWEIQYQWILKFVKEYEAYAKSPDVNSERLKKYTVLYEQLKPMAANAENMLRNVLNSANNLVNTERLAEVNCKTAEEAERKAKADREAADAAQREKLAKEDVARAEREALDNSKLNLSLKEHFVSATKQQQQFALSGGKMDTKESMRLVGADGIISVVQGDKFNVDAQTMVGQLIENLNNSILMSLHDHPDAMDAFTPEDIDSFAKLYVGQGAQINGIIANGFIKTIDFTGISKDVILQIGKLFSENISKAAQASGLFSYQDGQIIPSSYVKKLEDTNHEQHAKAMGAITELIDGSLNDAFREATGKESTLKAFSKDELSELTQYLLNIQNNAENAIKPVEKLKNLMMVMYPSKSFDWSQYVSVLDQFESGKISGIDAINQISTTNQKAAEAIEREKLTQEEVAKVAREKNSSYTPGGILDNPMFANMFGKTNKDSTSSSIVQENESLTEQSSILTNIQKLTSYIDEKYLSAGKHLYNFLDDLQSKSITLDSELKNILSTLGLINDKGDFTFNIKRNGESGGGTTHSGALISDNFVIIERDDYQKVKNSNLPTSTQRAYKNGMNVAQVYGYLPSKYTNSFFDVQSTAKGHNLFEGGVLSQDVVNATEQQLQQLVNAFIMAREHGFDIENGGSNIVYDSKEGFSFYDLEEWSKAEMDYWSKLTPDQKSLSALEDVLSIFGEINGINLNRDYTNINNDPNRNGFISKFRQAVGRDPTFANLDYQDVFDSVFGDTSGLDSISKSSNTAKQAVDSLNSSLAKKNQLEQADKPQMEVAEEDAKTEALKRQNQTLGENNRLKTEQISMTNGSAVMGTNINSESIVKTNVQPNVNTIPSTSSSAEVSSLETIRAKVAEVTTAINLKTEAFTKEESEVQRVVTSEIESLDLLEQKVTVITSSIEGLLDNIRTGQSDIGAGLNNIVVNVNHSENSSRVEFNPESFDRLVSAINNIHPQTTDVGNVLATESTLKVIRSVVETINSKISPHTTVKTGSNTDVSTALAVIDGSSDGNLGTAVKDASLSNSQSTDERFIERKRTALTSLLKYKTTLQEANQLHGDLENGINTLSNELNSVLDQSSLITWNEHFKQFKNASSILQTLVKDYEALGEAEAKAEAETNETKKSQYLDNAQIIRDRIDTKMVDVNINDDRFEMARQRAYNLASHKLQQKAEFSAVSQQEAEEKSRIKELSSDYEKLGQLRARAYKANGKNEKQSLEDQVKLQEESIRIKQQGLILDQSLYDIKALDAYNKELDKINQKLARKQDQENASEQKRAFRNAVQQSRQEAGISSANSALNKGRNTLLSAVSIDGLTDSQIERFKIYQEQIEKLNDLYYQIKNSDGAVTEEQKQELIGQTNNVNTLNKEINELISEYNRLSGDNAQVIGINKLSNDASLKEYKKQLTDVVMAATNGAASITGFDADTKTLSYTIKTGAYEITEYTASARQLDGQLVALQGNTKKLETPFESLKRKAKELFVYFGGANIIYRTFSELKQGITYIKEIDSALTELKKVTDETEETYDRFLNTAAKTADKVGSTIKEVVSSTADFARLGYSLADAAKMAENAQLLMNVSEFTDISSATDTLISAVQAFSYTADETLHVVDILNKIGK